jgi:FKBP-type peptidyl-prolyl cis-trans isomerase (trigger factor)
MSTSYTKLKKLKSHDSEIEFEAEIPLSALEENTAKVMVDISSTFELPGFRKGKVPEDVVRKHVDETHLFEDAANEALKDAIRDIATDSDLSIVGSPQISLEKISVGNPIVFKVKFALFPEIKLPDYKEIAKAVFERKDNTDVSDTELQQAIERVQKMLISEEDKAKSATPPELNDEFVKKIGPFKSVNEFKDELKKQLAEDKKNKQEEEKRDEMMRDIVKGSKLTVPPLLVDQELERFKEQRDINIKAAGFTFESYLKESGKTAEVMAKEERAFIEEQLKSQFVVSEIQKAENILATQQEIEMNAEFLKFRYPDQSEDYLRSMAETIIMNRKTFDILEGKKQAPVEELDKVEVEDTADEEKEAE